MPLYAGIDLGGTKIAGALVESESASIVARAVTPTEAQQGPDAVLKRIADFVRQLASDANIPLETVRAVGLGVPAVLDMDSGHTFIMPNLPGDWYDRPATATVSGHLGRPVWLVNDARSFTLGEANWGAGRGAHSVAGFTLGTGIGGGFAIDGRLMMGANAVAGEFGHIVIDPNGPPCGCGNRGCLEAHASGPAIAAMAVKAVLQGVTTNLGALVDYDLNKITPQIVMQAAGSGDAVARDILSRAGDYLGVGIANVMTIINPDRVVIGGGVAQLGDWIMEPIRAGVARHFKLIPIERLNIVRATLGTDAGVIGAATLAEQQDYRRTESREPRAE